LKPETGKPESEYNRLKPDRKKLAVNRHNRRKTETICFPGIASTCGILGFIFHLR
jgi:hypothetical protein